jgi:tRNA(fMet)-specific endonuclease VapC
MIYLLDTNMATYIVTGRSKSARETLKATMEVSTVAVSAITQAEILFGIENKPQASRLRAATEDFFQAVPVFPWDSAAANACGRLRARLSAAGKTLSAMDLLIAAHAVAVGAILVTREKAFVHAGPPLEVVDWALDL